MLYTVYLLYQSMIDTSIQYQIYSIMGICFFPIFVYIMYSIKKLIDKINNIKTLNKNKKMLMKKIQDNEATLKTQEIDILLENIQNDI
jgi:hypothetical protein